MSRFAFALVWLCSLVAALRCYGQTPAYRSAIVSVGQQINASSSASGVGTVVGIDSGKAYVVSCAHIFEQGQNPCWVEWPNGQRVRATLGAIDHRYDLAALTTSQPPAGVTAIPVAGDGEHPVQGDKVEFIGHGGGVWKHVVVDVTGYTTKDNLPGATQLVTNLQPISGDSGGPFIFKGRVVGVNWGGPAGGPQGGVYESHGSWSGRIAKVLTQCPGGSCGIGGGGYSGGGYGGGPPMAPQNMAPVAPQPPKTDPRLDQLILSYNETVKLVNKLANQKPPQAAGCQCDLSGIDARLKELEKQLAALAARPIPDYSEQIKALQAAIELARCQCQPTNVEPQKPAPDPSSPSGPASYDIIRRRKTGAS